MRRSQKIQKQIDELTAKQAAILDEAEAGDANGILTAEQQSAFDTYEAEKGKLATAMKNAIAVEVSQAASQELIRQPILSAPINPSQPSATAADVNASASLTVPATPKLYGSLQAFKGADADRNAFATGMYALAIADFEHPLRAKAREWCGKNGMQATMLTTDNPSAGYLVPSALEATVIELTEQYGVFRRNAEIVPMGTAQLQTPKWTGGMTAYWGSEGNSPTSTDPKWGLVELVAKKLGAKTKMSRELQEDAIINFGDKIAMCVAIAFASAEDNAAFEGDGTSTYGGIVGIKTKLLDSANAASVYEAAAGHTTLASLTLADFNGLLGKYPQYPGSSPKWYCHKIVWASSMVPLQLAAGGATPNDIRQGGLPSFLGYPVEFVQTRPTTYAVSTFPIFFGDLRLSSKLGDRRIREIKMGLENDDFSKELVTVLATQRCDIINHTIVDPLNPSTVAGPMMGLKLPAA